MRRLIRWIRQQDRIDEMLYRLELTERQIMEAYAEGKWSVDKPILERWPSQASRSSKSLDAFIREQL